MIIASKMSIEGESEPGLHWNALKNEEKMRHEKIERWADQVIQRFTHIHIQNILFNLKGEG